jgi:hypothetical protein
MRTPRLGGHVVSAAAILAVATVAAWVTRGSLQQDFAAYWVAGSARRLGLDPYVNYAASGGAARWDGVSVFAHSRFLYPPLVAELLRPWAALPYATAKALFTVLAVSAWVAGAVASARAAGARAATPVALAAGAVFFPLYLHLERGQVDLLALLGLLAAFRWRGRPAIAGGALAAAALLKPALLGALPVWVALGRGRSVAAAVGWLALASVATVAISGRALLTEYVTAVLPRAALYGEGGTETMLLPPDRLAAISDQVSSGVATIDGRTYPQSAWNVPAGASLPRLLAPDAPTRAAALLPYALAAVALIAAARSVRRRGAPPIAEAMLLFAAAVACVVTSTSGWVMGLVWALPLVPLLAVAWRDGAGSRAARRALGLALVACAIPAPVVGWAALAGAALVAAAAATAISAAGERAA